MPSLGLRMPTSLAGGSLRHWNSALWLLHIARQKTLQSGELWRPQLVIDPELPSADPQGLLLLDRQGNPCLLPIGDLYFSTAKDRNSLLQTILGRLPDTADAAKAVDHLLPRVGKKPLEACVDLWRQILSNGANERAVQSPDAENCSGDVADSAATPAPEVAVISTEEGAAPDAWVDAKATPEIVWISARHQRILLDLGIPTEDALRGETHLRSLLNQQKQNLISGQLKELQGSFQDHLLRIKKSVQEEAPGLYGSWARLRRGGTRAISDFQKSADRFQRNRKGIQGHRIHQLAQALRPADGPQQDGLSLLFAMATFPLHTNRAVEHSNVFHGHQQQGLVVVNTRTGIPSLHTLS